MSPTHIASVGGSITILNKKINEPLKLREVEGESNFAISQTLTLENKKIANFTEKLSRPQSFYSPKPYQMNQKESKPIVAIKSKYRAVFYVACRGDIVGPSLENYFERFGSLNNIHIIPKHPNCAIVFMNTLDTIEKMAVNRTIMKIIDEMPDNNIKYINVAKKKMKQ